MTYEYEYPRPAVSVDIVVIRPTRTEPEVLLVQRLKAPYQDCWALPGGFLEIDETLETAASRELREETTLETKSLEQIGAFSAVDRDPRGRVISVAFMASIVNESVASAADDAKSLQWFQLSKLPKLAFDHQEILETAIRHRTNKLKRS